MLEVARMIGEERQVEIWGMWQEGLDDINFIYKLLYVYTMSYLYYYLFFNS